MDRQIIYPGAIPLETDLLSTNKNAMIGLAKLASAILGTATLANGLAVTPNSPAALNVIVAPGEIYALENIDGSAYSSIAADTTHQVVKQGISLDATTLACAAPGTAGYSINYLIQAAYQDVDGGSAVLPYYNAGNPSLAYSGPANSGSAQNTIRKGSVALSAKAGAAATTGTQTTPSPDSGYVGLYVVTVANGATTIVSGNISAYAAAPTIPSLGLIVGGLQGNACNIAAAGGTADALTGAYAPAITALTNGMTLHVRAGSANTTATPTFTPASGVITAKTIVKGAGAALVAGDIAGAGHWIELQYDLTLDKWVLQNPATGVFGRVNLSAPLTLYVSPTGNDSNSGFSAGSPFLTIQAAFSSLAKNYDLASYPATIQLADGTYTAGLSMVQSLVGQAGVGGLTLNGNSGTPQNVVISTTSADAVSVSAGGAITLSNLKIQTTTSGNGILVASGGFVNLGAGIIFGACATAHINNTSGQFGSTASYSISGSAPVHWKNGDGATTVINGVTITLSGTPAFSSAFAQSYNSSILNVGSITFSGSATGTRYSASMNGVINVNGGGASYLPGSVAGSTATGGQYA